MDEIKDNFMVQVKDAKKSFDRQIQVLDGLNMNVKKNIIYGLLGPSGCGKTILLTSILGRSTLDSGTIKLGINSRNDVGYMPQEISLHKEFTIKEIFSFYGKLFALSARVIKERYKQLADVISLPGWTNTIGNLSGGEQRRVSFGVTLLHDPELLILDEPTVGVDTILSHNIWQYLLQLSAQGKTIIITTHYVEEAKNAHTIALMRGGVLLCEDSPEHVMSSQMSTTIEEAFLELSKQQEQKIARKENLPYRCPKEIRQGNVPLQEEDPFNWHRFSAQITKNVCWMKRNRFIMFFLLLLPAMQSFLYCISFGKNPKDLKIILVSAELPLERGRDFCDSSLLTYYESLNCTIKSPFTCHYMKELSSAMDIEIYSDVISAKNSIIQNKAWGLIYVPFNYTPSLIERISEEKYANDSVIDQSTVEVNMDMSNYVIANLLTKKISEAYVAFLEKVIISCGISSKWAEGFWGTVKMMDPIFGNKDPIYAHSGLPGFFCS